MRKVIITCAVTGAAEHTHINPAVPITPEEIANECLSAHKAGAAIVHIHVRDPDTGKPSMEESLYKEVVDRIRQKNDDVIIAECYDWSEEMGYYDNLKVNLFSNEANLWITDVKK